MSHIKPAVLVVIPALHWYHMSRDTIAKLPIVAGCTFSLFVGLPFGINMIFPFPTRE